MTKIERELAALEKKRDEKRREKLLRKRKAGQLEPPKKPKNKKLNGARLSHGPEQQNCTASIGGSILFVNKLPKSSPVRNIPGPVLLPGVEPSILLSRPNRIEDALYNERFVGIGLAEPETFIGRSYIESGRFVGRSYVESVINGANGLLRRFLLSDPYSRYLKPPPAGITGIPGPSSKSDLYGFANAVLEIEANSDF